MSRELRYSEVHYGETEAAESREVRSSGLELQSNELTSREVLTGQEVAEQAHLETKERMLEQHGECMNPEQIAMLESDETAKHLHVLESGEYVERFPEAPFEVLGHCDSDGEIYMKELDKNIVEHVSTHETMHLCANRENRIERDGTHVIRSGLRETRFEATGEQVDRNLAANEGTTELYTMRELRERGETEAANAVSAYSESRMWMERVEKIVGRDTLEEAYFGDRSRMLEAQFNYWNDSPRAWKEFSENLDVLERSGNPIEVANAKAKLAKQYATMYQNRYCK